MSPARIRVPEVGSYGSSDSVAPAIDATVRLLKRCKVYSESDYVLTLMYNLLTGGETLHDSTDCEKTRRCCAVPLPGWLALDTVGCGGPTVRRPGLPAERRDEPSDRPLRLRQGADYAYDHSWCYNVLYGTLAETGDVLYQGLREGNTYTSVGTAEVLPGTIDRVREHFHSIRMRGDSGFYDQEIVKICEAQEVEYFIVAEQHKNVLNAVRRIPRVLGSHLRLIK